MATQDDEEKQLRSVALQNAQSINLARQRAEEALLDQSEWLRITLSSIGDAVISTDAEGNVHFLNSVAESLTGWTLTEALGRALPDVFQIINEHSRQPVENPALRALRVGTIVGLANHTVLIARDGTERPIDDSAAPIRNKKGEVAGVVLVFRDITERKRLEAAQAERSRLVALRADVTTALASSQPTSTALQQSCEAFIKHLSFGFARIWTLNDADNQLEQQASAGLDSHLNGPRSRVPLGQFTVGRIASSRKPHLTDAVPNDPNVSEREWAKQEGMVSFAGYPLTIEGRLLGVVAMFAPHPLSEGARIEIPPLADRLAQFIERRRAEERLGQSEKRLRFIMDSMPQKIFTANPSGEVDYFNPQWSEFTGLPFDQIKGWNWAQFIHPDDLADSLRVWRHSIETGEEFHIENRFRRADGEYRWHFSRAMPQRDDQGRIAMWVGSTTDIHEQKETANRLRQLAANLSEADRRKNEFLAMLAHELRNPLAPIRNALQIVQLSGSDLEAVKSASEMMERQISQLVRLVDDLLDVSRISRGKIQLRREPVELASAIRQSLETCRPALELAQHELTVKLPEQSVYLYADPMRLAQAFSNLLHNACKYTDPQGHISLTAEMQDGEVLVTVKDTGVGIPPDMLSNVFEMFAQVDQSLERSQGGLGIGLTLVKRLVELHGGTVGVHSDGLGQGSEFFVRLPVMAAGFKAKPPEATVKEPSSTVARRILIVDDNRDSAESLTMLLQLFGNETYTAYDGLEAVEAAARFKPEVVLLDIGLPILNGYEAARKIREQPWGKNMVLVALTGWGQEEDRQKSNEAGFNDHMVKPVDYDALMKLLAELQSTSG